MKKIKLFLIACITSVTLYSCFEDLDDNIQLASTLDIQNYIYSAMNIWYLYKPEVPDLANDRFSSQAELNAFLNTFSTPEDLFYDGLLSSGSDRFSFITPDYRELEAQLAGITLHHGMEYGLVYYPGSTTNVFGYVRYVLPNSDAANKGVIRGMIFNSFNGTQLTVDNHTQLRILTSYEIGLATFDGTTITPTEESISLSKTEMTENPVHLSSIINFGGQKVGYLLYNGFTSPFDQELNTAFGMYKSEAVTDLIIDLRYNGGGSVKTATYLASMITGQFNNQVFYTEQWNPELQEHFEQTEPGRLTGKFVSNMDGGTTLNNLNLSRVFILTSANTASASELVINGLNPYIEVIQVGGTTTGKFQASSTFYDAPPPNFRRSEASNAHYYAIQPLIFTTANANGETGFINGLAPDIEIFEDFSNLGTLGDENEPVLNTALNYILNHPPLFINNVEMKELSNSKKHLPTYQRMYVELE